MNISNIYNSHTKNIYKKNVIIKESFIILKNNILWLRCKYIKEIFNIHTQK